MAISRIELLKDLLPNMNRAFAEDYEALKIDQIIHNEAIKQKELEHLIKVGKTFRNDAKVAHIIENEQKKKDIQDAILNDRLQVVAKAGTMGGKTARVLRNEQKKKELKDAV